MLWFKLYLYWWLYVWNFLRFLKKDFVTSGVLFKTVSSSRHKSRSLVFVGVWTETGTGFPKVVLIITPSSFGTILWSCPLVCFHLENRPAASPCSVQLVWLVRELVKSSIMGADGVVMTLLKQIAGEMLTRAGWGRRESSGDEISCCVFTSRWRYFQ